MCNCEEHERTVQEIFAKLGITDQITCVQAHDIVESYDITLADIGAYCEKENVKIKKCQLGCF